jgi:excisionase family DNA binding protein
MKRRTLSISEVATILGVGRNTAYRAAKAGQIPTIRVGGRILVPLAALNDLIREAPDVALPADSHGDK